MLRNSSIVCRFYFFLVSGIIAITVVYLNILSLSSGLLRFSEHDNQFVYSLTSVVETYWSRHYEQILTGTAFAPYQYRLGSAYTIKLLTEIGLPFSHAYILTAIALYWIVLVLLYYTLHKMAKLRFVLPVWLYFVWLSPTFFITGDIVEMSISYIVILAFLELMVGVATNRTLNFLLACIFAVVGMLTRESTLVIIVAYQVHLIYRYLRLQPGASEKKPSFLITRLIFLTGLTLGVLLLVRTEFAHAPPYPLTRETEIILGLEVPRNIYLNLTSPKILYNALVLFALPAPFIWKGWTKATIPYRILAVCAALLVLPYFFYGQLSEARMFSEAMLSLTPVFVLGLRDVV